MFVFKLLGRRGQSRNVTSLGGARETFQVVPTRGENERRAEIRGETGAQTTEAEEEAARGAERDWRRRLSGNRPAAGARCAWASWRIVNMPLASSCIRTISAVSSRSVGAPPMEMLTALAVMEGCDAAAAPLPIQIARRLRSRMVRAFAAASSPPIAVSIPARVATNCATSCGLSDKWRKRAFGFRVT